ncbi:invasion associated locus B family protein [Methylocystis sp. JAN1]|uniref:invasion associated locus B family protein n=1 Tax=Methylocystis sp. JAN1 TaxID=3397211 RepID=UPI003FA33A8E
MINESPLPSALARAFALLGLSLALAFVGAPAPALAKEKPAAKDKKDAKDKPAAEEAPAPDAAADKKGKKAGKTDKADRNGGGGKPEQLGTYGEWGAYLAQGGKDKTCYALGQPKSREPKAKLKDTSAYVFISSRPGDGVRNEVAINLGYGTKDGSAATAEIDGDGWELVTKGQNAWVKDQSKEKEFVGALRGGSKLIVKASSSKGTSTTDTYTLKGLSDALARVAQECK